MSEAVSLALIAGLCTAVPTTLTVILTAFMTSKKLREQTQLASVVADKQEGKIDEVHKLVNAQAEAYRAEIIALKKELLTLRPAGKETL